MSESKKEKLTEVELKLRRPHKRGAMRLQKHLVKHAFAKFDLNEKEMAELNSKGGKHWFVSKEDDAKAKAERKKAAEEKAKKKK